MNNSKLSPIPTSRAFTAEMKEDVINRLLSAWIKSPEERLSQFIVNAIGNTDIFYIEDGPLVKACERYADQKR
jgi:hypothetical protein